MRTSFEVIVEVELARPRAVVWPIVSDPERLPDWVGEFQVARTLSDGPLGRGTVVEYTLEPGNRSGTYELVEWDPPRGLAWDGPPMRWAGGGIRPRGSQALTETGDGRTLLVSRYLPELIGPPALLRPYLERWLRRQRRADAQILKALIETGAPS